MAQNILDVGNSSAYLPGTNSSYEDPEVPLEPLVTPQAPKGLDPAEGPTVPEAPQDFEVPQEPEPEVPQEPMVDLMPEEVTEDEVPLDVTIKDEVDWGELDWGGWEENSLVVQAGQVLKNWYDPNYDIPGSKEDLLNTMEMLKQDQIDYAGFDQDSEYIQQVQADIFTEMEKTSNALKTMEALETMDGPTVMEIVDAVMDDPERFAFNMAQESINKPELAAAGLIGGYGFGLLGARVLTVMNATGKAAQAAKIIGSGAGAYTGGVVVGTADRSIENANKGGEWRVGDAWDQSQTDGIISLATFGLVKTLDNGVRSLLSNSEKAIIFEDKVTNSDEINFSKLRDSTIDEKELLEQTMQPEDLGLYKDPQGVVHVIQDKVVKDQMDIDEVQTLVNMFTHKLTPAKVDKLSTKVDDLTTRQFEIQNRLEDIKHLAEDPKASKEIAKLTEELDTVIPKVTKLNNKLDNHSRAIDAFNKLYEAELPIEVNRPKHIQAEGPDGTPVLLQRVDKSVQEEGLVIDGFNPYDFTLTATNKGYNNIGDVMRQRMFQSVVTPLSKLADVSPTAALLVAKLDPSLRSNKAPLWSLQEDIIDTTGKWNNEFSTVIEDLKQNTPGKLKDLEKQVMLYMRGVDKENASPQVVKAAEGIRKILDDQFTYLKESGVKISEHGTDYLPRKFKRDYLKTPEGRQAFLDRVMISEKKSLADAEESLKKITDNLSEDNGVLTKSGGSDNVHPFGNRTMHQVTDAELSDMLSEDFFADLTKHLMRGSRRAEMSKVFGDGGSDIHKILTTVSKEAKEAGRPLHKTEEKSVYDIYNAIAGRYKPIETEELALANNAVATAVNISKLGLATVTSLTEPLMAIARMNETSGLSVPVNTYVEGVKGLIRKVFKDLPEHEAVIELRELGPITDVALSEAIEALQGVGMEGRLATVNNKFFKVTGLHGFTELSKAMTFHTAKSDIQKTIAKLSSGKDVATRKRWLREVGLDHEQASQWLRAGGDVTAPYYKQIQRAAVRMTHQTIANPDPINRPLWMSTPKMRLIAQLKGYMVTFGNSVIKHHWQEGKALVKERNHKQIGVKTVRTLATVGVITSGQMLIGMFKDAWGGREDTKSTPQKIAKAALSQLGPISVLAPIVNASGETWAASTILGTISPALGSAGQILADPRKGLVETLPGYTALPGPVKDKLKGK
jgi:hypothetical protein